MNILFYTPFNTRSRDTESLMEAFVKQGHHVSLLTQAARGPYHERCEQLGVITFTHVINQKVSFTYFLRHARYLASFTGTNKIDVIYAHLEYASLPAVLIQPFTSACVFVCRHIVDEAYLLESKKFILLNKIVYRLARNIIVVSERSRDFMITREKINPSKIRVIRLAYNFSHFDAPDQVEVQKIKSEFSCSLLLITACRLLPAKKVDVAIAVIYSLVYKGYDVKLLVLGAGSDLDRLKKLTSEKKLNDKVFFIGYKNNINDYLCAGDILLHPSIQDSSSVIIKEAGLNKMPVIACSGIGDVDEYLTNGVNAILVNKDNPIEEMVNSVKTLASRNERIKLGTALSETVRSRFDIKKIISSYDEIHSSIQPHA